MPVRTALIIAMQKIQTNNHIKQKIQLIPTKYNKCITTSSLLENSLDDSSPFMLEGKNMFLVEVNIFGESKKWQLELTN